MTDQNALRSALGRFPTGVTVVTTRKPDGTPIGFTANSFTSVSLDPPMLLVCPGKFLSCFDVFNTCENFGVSVLSEGQEGVSNVFASRNENRFDQVETRNDHHNVPLIEGAAATFSCRTANIVEAGDHIILIGQISDFSQSDARGLGFASGQYFSLGLEQAAANVPHGDLKAIVGAIIESDGAVLLEETPNGLRPPQMPLKDKDQIRQAFGDHLAVHGLNAKIGRAYSIFENRSSGDHFTYYLAKSVGQPKSSLGTWVSLSDLDGAKYHSHAHGVMLKRYAFEHSTRDFRLYIGTEHGGEHHEVF